MYQNHYNNVPGIRPENFSQISPRIGRRSLDDAREALAEYLALLPSMAPEIRDGGTQESGTTTLIPRGENPEGFEKELKTVLKLYGRAVEVLREKRERELLTESLCDLGDLYVSKDWARISCVFVQRSLYYVSSFFYIYIRS